MQKQIKSMQKALYTLLITIVTTTALMAQPPLTESKKANKLYVKGSEYYKQKMYVEAENAFLKAIKEVPTFKEAYMVLAEIYWDQKNLELAAETYGKGLAIEPGFYPRGYINKASLEMAIGKYDDAIISYTSFLEFPQESEKLAQMAEYGLRCARFAQHSVKNPVEFDPKNLGENINTVDDEYWPSLSADGEKLVITRRLGSSKGGTNQQEDFFISY
ncbi:MAG: hypothetical protein MI922_26370, partial [Bacteroidales bacterium]|nr:hypothetical protein [Bacteroidales bacterium]